MIDIVTVFLKKCLESNFPSGEFTYLLEEYQYDFRWTSKEMLAAWRICAELIKKEHGPMATFLGIAAVASREKLLRQVAFHEREFWRRLVNYGVKETEFFTFFKDKKPTYLSDLEDRFAVTNILIVEEIQKVKALARDAGSILADGFNSEWEHFRAAIRDGKNILKRSA